MDAQQRAERTGLAMRVVLQARAPEGKIELLRRELRQVDCERMALHRPFGLGASEQLTRELAQGIAANCLGLAKQQRVQRREI